jgi:hypothetical protein
MVAGRSLLASWSGSSPGLVRLSSSGGCDGRCRRGASDGLVVLLLTVQAQTLTAIDSATHAGEPSNNPWSFEGC